jgi:hypothetical protein
MLELCYCPNVADGIGFISAMGPEIAPVHVITYKGVLCYESLAEDMPVHVLAAMAAHIATCERIAEEAQRENQRLTR